MFPLPLKIAWKMDGCRQGSKTQILLFSTIMNASFHRQTVAPDFYLDPIKDAPKRRLFNFVLFIAVIPLIMLYSNKKEEIDALYARVLDCGLEPFYEPPRKQDEAW